MFAEEVKLKVGDKMPDFLKWMYGQTVGLRNGKIDYYDYDVERFIRYNCDPKREPLEEVD